MADKPAKSASKGKVFYTLRPRKEGRSAFSDVKLPDGTVIRRVDESIHKRALSNAARAYREKA